MAKKIKTINIVPTWGWAMQVYITSLEIGREEGKKSARAELMRIANMLDTHDLVPKKKKR